MWWAQHVIHMDKSVASRALVEGHLRSWPTLACNHLHVPNLAFASAICKRNGHLRCIKMASIASKKQMACRPLAASRRPLATKALFQSRTNVKTTKQAAAAPKPKKEEEAVVET
ncbi:hypothetical protein HaLaN_25139 [Haematococcus lacustris]|uniref:Uncharacterized protein n=1 Tax=Haematococcus lacustris TaxID=44745 RepID=A0A699ZVG9_HAELA|nr:hypothetical protein HaLaN_25139 [Haematococcus lacustris]